MMAMANEHIVGDMVEANEFPELSDRYGVQGVPKTVINEEFEVMGGQPEEVFLQEVLRAAGM